MKDVASKIKKLGARPGVWMRPLLTKTQLPENLRIRCPQTNPFEAGFTMDPSIPEVLELVKRDISTLRGWGYELIKHDFSTYDVNECFHLIQTLFNSTWGASMRTVVFPSIFLSSIFTPLPSQHPGAFFGIASGLEEEPANRLISLGSREISGNISELKDDIEVIKIFGSLLAER